LSSLSQNKSNINAALIGEKSNSHTPPFLLTFEIYNRNAHNCLVDSGASSNEIPFSVCKKLNIEPKNTNTHIVQLDRSNVKVLRELKDVLIRLSYNPKVHQLIDIVIVDILESYGLLLSRDWSEKLNGYFSTDWSHLWLPYNGQPNKINVEHERHMKHTVIDLNDHNEPVIFSHSTLGNYCFDLFFGNCVVDRSPFADSCNQSEILHTTQAVVSK
jgi:hypothetical protein